MTDDIVMRLREEGFITHMARLPRESKILHAAADEIERLRRGGCARDQNTTQFCAEAAALQIEVQRLRKERDDARRWITDLLFKGPVSKKKIAEAHGWNDLFPDDDNDMEGDVE